MWPASRFDAYVDREPTSEQLRPKDTWPVSQSDAKVASEPIRRLGGPQANPMFMWPASQYDSLLRGTQANHAGVYVAREPI